jgi:hypothetical protein
MGQCPLRSRCLRVLCSPGKAELGFVVTESALMFLPASDAEWTLRMASPEQAIQKRQPLNWPLLPLIKQLSLHSLEYMNVYVSTSKMVPVHTAWESKKGICKSFRVLTLIEVG